MLKKILVSFFAVILFLSTGAQRINADDTYTVSVDGGLYGKVEPSSDVKVAYGTTISIEQESDTEWSIKDTSNNSTLYTISIDSSKDNAERYYIKGLHISGQYLEIGDLKLQIKVTEDIYLVPAFGVKGNRISYKVYYLTEDGDNLLTDAEGNPKEYDVFYCNINDPVIVGSKYFDGYEVTSGKFFDGSTTAEYDNVIGMQKTIDDEGYVFTFIYSQATGGETVIYDTTYEYEPGQPVAPGGTTPGGTTPEPTPAPPEIIDIDNPTTPTTEPTINPEPTVNPDPTPTPEPSFWEILFSTPWLIGSVIAALAMLIFFLIFLFRRKDRNER